jgi:hypothetical protein
VDIQAAAVSVLAELCTGFDIVTEPTLSKNTSNVPVVAVDVRVFHPQPFERGDYPVIK